MDSPSTSTNKVNKCVNQQVLTKPPSADPSWIARVVSWVDEGVHVDPGAQSTKEEAESRSDDSDADGDSWKEENIVVTWKIN